MKKAIVVTICVVLALVLILYKQPTIAPGLEPQSTPGSDQTSGLVAPIANATARATKKTFGLKIDPRHSPISPERFTGFHVGTDFETTPEEANLDVAIVAACEGTLRLKKWSAGYGGVAVQNCTLGDEPVTVIYGHLRLASITAKEGQKLTQGEVLGMLGKGNSYETDYERKHLHFSIHKGNKLDIRGYVPVESLLQQWIDPMTALVATPL